MIRAAVELVEDVDMHQELPTSEQAKIEVEMVSRLAERAHRAGGKFAEWPRIRTETGGPWFHTLCARVWVIPR